MPLLTVQPRPFLYGLLGIVGALSLLHAAALVLEHGFGFEYAMGFSGFVHLDAEGNLPTFVAVLLLLFGAGLAGLNGFAAQGRDRAGWLVIAAAFFFVALDEHFSIHEPLGYHLHQRFDALPLFAWVVPYGIVAALAGLLMLPWLRRLDRPTQGGLILAAGLYLGGAIGMELLSSAYVDSRGGIEAETTLFGDLLATAEEVLEFLGVTVFLYTLVKRLGGLRIGSAVQP